MKNLGYGRQSRRVVTLVVTATMLAMPAVAMAQTKRGPVDDFPNKPVRFISPFSAGGGTDTVARAVAQKLSEAMGKSFVVDNRGGAEGIIGTEMGARAPADGYTLTLANPGTLSMTPHLRKVPYDPLKDFATITQTTSSSVVLVVHPSMPVKTLKDFVAYAKSRPGQLNYGSSSNGTALPMELLKMMADIQLNRIPYKGTGPALIAIMSSEVSVMFGGSINTVPHVLGGKLRALAVAGDRRTTALPDVPTVAEAGYPGYVATTWNGIVAPAKTPRAIIDKLNAAIVKVLSAHDIRDIMVKDGAEPVTGTPEEFAKLIRNDYERWAKVINTSGLKATP